MNGCNTLGENYFIDYLSLGTSLSLEKCISILGEFHTKSTREDILEAFMYLRDEKATSVTFRKSVNGSHECILMEVLDGSGKTIGTHLLDTYTGQPEAKIG